VANPDRGGSGLLSKLARLAAKATAESGIRQSIGGPRNAAPRDPQRDRDATSLGVTSAKMSRSGAALYGGGLAAGGTALVTKIGKRFPIRLGPIGWQGGGGIALRGRW
jgi:hypothetical protein